MALPASAQRWLGPIRAAASAAGVPANLLIALVWAESGFNATARSHAGAIGLAQLMPGTARGLGVDPYDPIQNLAGGARYLRQQLDRFGRQDLALAAYNAGPGRVAKAGGIPNIRETRAYVPKVLGYMQQLGGSGTPPNSGPRPRAGGTDSTIAAAARRSGTTVDALTRDLPEQMPRARMSASLRQSVGGASRGGRMPSDREQWVSILQAMSDRQKAQAGADSAVGDEPMEPGEAVLDTEPAEGLTGMLDPEGFTAPEPTEVDHLTAEGALTSEEVNPAADAAGMFGQPPEASAQAAGAQEAQPDEGLPTAGLPPAPGGGQSQGGLPRLTHPTTPGKNGIPSGLKSNAAQGAAYARQLGFGGTIGGIGGRSYASDHPHGNAIDLMTYSDTAKGWSLANFYHANRAALGVKYIIFDAKIASPKDNWAWRPYGSTPDGNRSATALHRDHVHISFS